MMHLDRIGVLKYIGLSLPLILLFSCSSLPPCHQINWAEQGTSDALAGSPIKLRKHEGRCGKLSEESSNQYITGYENGIFQYCTEESGHKVGLSGAKYNGICPVEMEEKFIKAYTVGFAKYSKRAKNLEGVETLGKEKYTNDTNRHYYEDDLPKPVAINN